MLRLNQEALTFDDVLLVPAHSTIVPSEVDLRTQLTRDIELRIPLVSAAMDTVTESRLAITLALEGGIGIVHKNMSVGRQAREVLAVKKYESGIIRDPITVGPETSIGDVVALTHAHNISGVPVTENGQLTGIVTGRDLRFETRMDAPVSTIMTPRERLVTVKEGAHREEVLALLHKHRIEKVLVVNDAFELRGMITVKDIQKAKDFPKASRDDHGRLRVGAAVAVGAGTDERVTTCSSSTRPTATPRVCSTGSHGSSGTSPTCRSSAATSPPRWPRGRWSRPGRTRSRSASARDRSAPPASSPVSAFPRSPRSATSAMHWRAQGSR
jgi:IMP dehydrogenase